MLLNKARSVAAPSSSDFFVGGRIRSVRKMGGAPRNPAPGNHLLVWIVKSPGCHCTDAFGGKEYRRLPTSLRSTSPFSESGSVQGLRHVLGTWATPTIGGIRGRAGKGGPRDPSGKNSRGEHLKTTHKTSSLYYRESGPDPGSFKNAGFCGCFIDVSRTNKRRRRTCALQT